MRKADQLGTADNPEGYYAKIEGNYVNLYNSSDQEVAYLQSYAPVVPRWVNIRRARSLIRRRLRQDATKDRKITL